MARERPNLYVRVEQSLVQQVLSKNKPVYIVPFVETAGCFEIGNTTENRREGNITIITDAVRAEKEHFRFQEKYFRLFPPGTRVSVVWTDEKHDRGLAVLLERDYNEGRADGVFLSGGEHLHPETTGANTPADEKELQKYNGYSLARDRAGLVMLNFAEEKGLPIVAVCRGFELVASRYSDRLAIPNDHNQDQHTFISSPQGEPALREHAVKDILPPGVRNRLAIQVPHITSVNSAHAQGFKLGDITPEAMAALNSNGWYPWLIADLPGILPEEQVIEGLIRVKEDGAITGIALQSHPEMHENGAMIRRFIQEVIKGNPLQSSGRRARER